jgi:hypothetical protein
MTKESKRCGDRSCRLAQGAFFITQGQKAQLREMGRLKEHIAGMERADADVHRRGCQNSCQAVSRVPECGAPARFREAGC